jgi:hypothetical protein
MYEEKSLTWSSCPLSKDANFSPLQSRAVSTAQFPTSFWPPPLPLPPCYSSRPHTPTHVIYFKLVEDNIVMKEIFLVSGTSPSCSVISYYFLSLHSSLQYYCLLSASLFRTALLHIDERSLITLHGQTKHCSNMLPVLVKFYILPILHF